MSEKLIDKHVMSLGEELSIETKFFLNDAEHPDGIFWNQRIMLQGQYNDCSINLYADILTPGLLRDLANQLDEKSAKIKALYPDF